MDLYGRQHVRPLDFILRTYRDHAFVLIGRAHGSRIDDFKTRGPHAVVCDPWDGKAYATTEIPTKTNGGASPFGVQSEYRANYLNQHMSEHGGESQALAQ